jgi:hypothetical protein
MRASPWPPASPGSSQCSAQRSRSFTLHLNNVIVGKWYKKCISIWILPQQMLNITQINIHNNDMFFCFDIQLLKNKRIFFMTLYSNFIS